jgi:hypothetical protein
MSVKKGVTPGMIRILAAISRVEPKVDYPSEVVITSGTDGRHMAGSRHYTGNAIDIRSFNFKSKAVLLDFVAALRGVLGKDFDVVVESDHVHCEFDPKSHSMV